MTYRRRIITALSVLRGRPPRVDYGILLVMPFLAAAGGSLIGLAVEAAVDRRRARTVKPEAGAEPVTVTRPAPAPSIHPARTMPQPR